MEKVKVVKHLIKKGFIYLFPIIFVTLLVVLIYWGYKSEWTGFIKTNSINSTTIQYKTLWDWLELLIIPMILAIGALFFNKAERENEIKISNSRLYGAELQNYLDKISDLLLKEGLRTSDEGSEVRKIARARTLAALSSLGGKQKGMLVRFLYETGLINKGNSIISLQGADLIGADLHRTNLDGADLRGVDLWGANLRKASLRNTDLSHSELTKTILRFVDFTNTDLSYSNLVEVDLRQAIISNDQLKQILSLKNAIMPNGKNTYQEKREK